MNKYSRLSHWYFCRHFIFHHAIFVWHKSKRNMKRVGKIKLRIPSTLATAQQTRLSRKIGSDLNETNISRNANFRDIDWKWCFLWWLFLSRNVENVTSFVGFCLHSKVEENNSHENICSERRKMWYLRETLIFGLNYDFFENASFNFIIFKLYISKYLRKTNENFRSKCCWKLMDPHAMVIDFKSFLNWKGFIKSNPDLSIIKN